MHQRKRLCALAVVPLLAMALSAQTPDGDHAGSIPASDGQAAAAAPQTVKVASHSSRWDYPRELSLGSGQEVHVVVKGDTLWDLGNQYLGNPFAWPQIWELNKWVKDPHWIYPGDPIVVEGSRKTVGQQNQDLVPNEVADLAPDIRRGKLSQDEYAYSFQDFVQMPYLVAGQAEAYLKRIGSFKIVGQQDSTKDMMAEGDFLYISGGSNQGVKAGDRLVVTIIAARKFYHPDDKYHRKVLGDVLEQVGIIRVTEVHASQSVAIIERSLDGITKGSYAAPYAEPPSIINVLRTDIASPIALKPPVSKVIYIRENKAVAAGGDLVIIDHGSRDGLKVGDVLLSARSTPLVDNPGPQAPPAEMTNFYLGQVIVIRAGEQFSTCRILRSKSEVLVGDILTH